MSDWRRKTRAVEAREVCFCKLCGAEVVRLNFANGHPYWTNVEIERGQRIVVEGAGMNFNFKPEHDCLKVAENNLRNAESTYGEFYRKHAEAKNTLATLADADAQIAANGQTLDDQTAKLIKGIRESAENTFKTLDAQKPGIDQLIEATRAKVELLRQGKSIIPSDKPAIGRVAKVVKGRKVPVGTQGTIFWMGLDQYREDSLRVGIDANGTKHYTSSENIQIVTP